MQEEELRRPGIIATSDSLTTSCRPLSLAFDSCHSRAPALITCMESSDRVNMLASRDLPQAKPGLEREMAVVDCKLPEGRTASHHL